MQTQMETIKFSQLWLTLTDLGEIFGYSPREFGLYLEEAGLRFFDTTTRQHFPTPLAQNEGFCTPTHSRRKKGLLYLWNKQKVSTYLQETLRLQPLDEKDLHARKQALHLLRYCKRFPRLPIPEFDPLRHVFFAPMMPTILAWYVIEERKQKEVPEPNSYDLFMLIDRDYFATINHELARLESPFRINEEAFLDATTFPGEDGYQEAEEVPELIINVDESILCPDCSICQAIKSGALHA